jgi:selenocysteine-specific elongation factor
MTHAVIGTAGHVDHGKTSLVRVLTGVDCDRLAEEKRRGITIELGFARWALGPDLTASIVDVPGHERFVETMVAGASGFDLVMLVVAADDGVMPQTREHLAICEELGVRSGVLVISKSDLAGDMLPLVIEEAREVTKGTFLEGAPAVCFSIHDENGKAELTRAVTAALRSLSTPPRDGPPWLAIDRVFTKHGFGTIATGTLVRGSISVGDELTAIPGELLAPVRGLYVHDTQVERASATTRVAVNLRAERTQLERGLVLTKDGVQSPATAIDVELHLLPGAKPLGVRTSYVLHVGTSRATVRARPLSPLTPGERGIVRLTSKMPFATYAGQRFVLRRPELGADRTVGGGTVVDPHPSRSRRSRASLEADLEERVVAMVEESTGLPLDALRRRLPFGTDVERTVARLVGKRRILEARREGRTFFSLAHLALVKKKLLETLERFHREHHAVSGATAADLEGALPPRFRALTPRAIADLVEASEVLGGERIRLPAHDAERVNGRVAELYERAGLTPPADTDAPREAGVEARAFRDAVADLVRQGRLARVASGLYVHRSHLDSLIERVRAHLGANATLSPGDFKTLTGLTRKNAIALLEWLDKEGVTKRQGDLRVRA